MYILFLKFDHKLEFLTDRKSR